MSQAPISVPQSFTIARSADSSGSLNDFDIVDLNEIFSGIQINYLQIHYFLFCLSLIVILTLICVCMYR